MDSKSFKNSPAFKSQRNRENFRGYYRIISKNSILLHNKKKLIGIQKKTSNFHKNSIFDVFILEN